MVEGGSLENCFSGIPANEGSNPSSSARNCQGPGNGALSFCVDPAGFEPCEGKTAQWAVF